jgi:hypothetical protein
MKTSLPLDRARLSGPRRACALALLGAACACDSHQDSRDDGPSYATLPVIAGCQQQSFEACDPLDEGCRTRVFETMKCLRQMPDAVMPPVRVLTSAEQLAEFQTESDEDADEVKSRIVMERALMLLHLAEKDELSLANQAQVFVDTTVAYYSHDTGVVTLSAQENDEPRDLESETLTLSHEFVHALQDQDVDLAHLFDGADTFDDYLGRTSLVEGEATMQEGFVSAAIWGFADNPDFREHFTYWLTRITDELDGSPLLMAPRFVPYTYGSRFVYNVYEHGGLEEVLARFREPPHSVLPILLSVDQLDEPAIESFADLAAPARDGFEQVASDTLGPWVLRTFLERALPGVETESIAEAWRGDRLLAYSTPETGQTVAALWTLRFADSTGADNFQLALRDRRQTFLLPANSFVSRRDRDVTIGVSEDATALPDWSASLDVAQQSWGQSAPPSAAPKRSRLAEIARRLQRR